MITPQRLLIRWRAAAGRAIDAATAWRVTPDRASHTEPTASVIRWSSLAVCADRVRHITAPPPWASVRKLPWITSWPVRTRRSRVGSSARIPARDSNPRAPRSCARSRNTSRPGRVHDRGRCPLYVRAQLDTVGLSWTQRDLAGQKTTAREAGKIQLTGCFRWWWQVLGSNQRRLSRRFYRPLPLGTIPRHEVAERQLPLRPVRGTLRDLFQGPHHHLLLHLGIGDGARHPRPQLIGYLSSRSRKNPARHRFTVLRLTPSRAATAMLLPPCAQASTIHARSARHCAVLRRLTQYSNVRRSSPVSTSGSSLALPSHQQTALPSPAIALATNWGTDRLTW